MSESIEPSFEPGDERQADWTFLLPFTKESVVLRCGQATENESMILKKRCRELTIAPLSDIPEKPAFDIIAAPEPSGESLKNSFSRVFARLKKGGYVYVTVKNRWKIKKQLKNAGFSEIMAYAVLPGPSLPIFFVPLHSRGAIQYFFRQLCYLLATASVETKRRYRFPYFLIRVIIPILPSFLLVPLIRWFSPYYAFVAKKTNDEATDFHGVRRKTFFLEGQATRPPRRTDASIPLTGALSASPKALEKRFCGGHHDLMISGSIEGGTLTSMVFPDRSTKPAFVLRVLRDETQLPQFLQERDILVSFQTFSPFLRDSVPRLMSCEKIIDQWILQESVVNGIPMTTERHVDIVLPWLIALAKETKKPSVSGLSWEATTTKIFSEYQNFFPVSEAGQDFFERFLNAFRTYAPKEPSTFLVHGDFSRHNLFVSGSSEKFLFESFGDALRRHFVASRNFVRRRNAERAYRQFLEKRCFSELPSASLNVIDWMSARWSLFPFHDLCLFLTSFHLHSRAKAGIDGYLEVFEKSFFIENVWGNLAKGLLTRYALALRFDPKLTPFFFGFFLIEQAVLEAKRCQALEERGVMRERANRDIFQTFFQFFVKNQSTFIFPL